MKITESEFIWFNGQLVPWGEARIHVLSHVVHYGSGVFEGMRVYPTPEGPAVLGLEERPGSIGIRIASRFGERGRFVLEAAR